MSAIAITPHTRFVNVAAAGRSADRRASVRLTRRGRVVVLLAGLLVVLAAGVMFGASSVATDQAAETETIVIGGGETLWGVADEVAGDGSTSDMVAQIRELNDLDSGLVLAGQKLIVPAN